MGHLEWIFSGIGVFVLGLFITRGVVKNRQKQKVSKNSTGYQAGGSINIGTKPDETNS